MFSPTRLTVARKRRGFTKARLAELVDVTSRSITAYEAGEMEPSVDTVAALARALRFPADFFAGPELDEPLSSSASFRALTSMTAAQRDAALGAGTLAVELARWVEARFSLPTLDLPDLRGHEPEAAAEALRAQWDLGERPVRNMVHLLEVRGVRVFSLAEECLAVDAFSLWRVDVPFVFLNTQKSAERGRFDAAHELGHLVLHRHGGPQGRTAEIAADRFASAFLMPRASVLATARRGATLRDLVQLKRAWNVSVAALAHRLRALDLLTEWQYRTVCIEIAKRGYRTTEPASIPREVSQILSKVFAALRQDGISKSAVAREIRVLPSEIDALVFGLVLVPLDGGRT